LRFLEAGELDGLSVVDHFGEVGVDVGGGAGVRDLRHYGDFFFNALPGRVVLHLQVVFRAVGSLAFH